MNYKSAYYLLFFLIFLLSCQEDNTTAVFSKLSKSKTGIDFRNMLKENEQFNIFKYQYFNNGGGLAIGDFNNDELPDIVFTGNMVKNRLFVNKGDLRFADVTKGSGIAEQEGWCTGVTTVDINQDGWLDIYICRAAYPFQKIRTNLLFINNGNLTFTEKAAEYGLDDAAFSTHSAFLDYDKDGDLDLFLLNHSTVEYSKGSLEVVQLRNKKDPDFTNKLYRNEGGKFINVTEEAGITSNVLTFSLGVSIADLNQDNWPDIFIGNDFNEPDYLFINQGDGTFSDEFSESFDHSAMFSMGSDVADYNNDGLLDIVNLDMLPESNYLQKMHSGADNYDKIAHLQKSGFKAQYSRNMLQQNNGDGTFTEVGQMNGISNTDWSWAPLFFDFDNDGFKDLFIANGYPKDHTDMDFLNFTADEVKRMDKGGQPIDFDGYMAQMPAILLPNYFYRNNTQGAFENKTEQWGLDEAMVSQSAAYADLDMDGDLDLVLNNTGDFAAVYRNNTEQLFNHNYLKIKLNGHKKNISGLGAKVKVYAAGQIYLQEQQPVRGFQSSVDQILHFGLGNVASIDSLVVTWPTDEVQVLGNVQVNQLLNLKIDDAQKKKQIESSVAEKWFEAKEVLNARHEENDFNDFNYQRLLPKFYSREGPALAVADVNGDGREDVFLGKGIGAAGELLLQNAKGDFVSSTLGSTDQEAVASVFFDANADGAPDLYIAHGGFESEENGTTLIDQFYLNNGNGAFVAQKEALPKLAINSTCVKATDVDADGDIDLFLGGGYIHGKYPNSYNSFWLRNNGNAKFEEIIIPDIQGAVSDAIWADLNGDQKPELIVAAEWSPLQIFSYDQGGLINQTNKYTSEKNSNGLWSAVHAADFDGDGDLDLVVGNHGKNSQWHAGPEEPMELFAGDFDSNGSIDPLLCTYVQGKSWPFVSREDLLSQLPGLKKQFLFFKDYANAQIQDILSAEALAAVEQKNVHELASVYFENDNGRLIKRTLPIEAQCAPVHAISSLDVNQDGHLDMVLAGNDFHVRFRLGRLDGNHGLVLLGDGRGNFRAANYVNSGLKVLGATRALEKINITGSKHLIFGLNDGPLKTYQLIKQ